MAEADAEDGHPPHQVGHRRGRAREGGGVARPVGEEDAVGLERQHLGRRGAGGHHRDGAQGGQEPDHGRLHAEVVGHDAQAARRALSGARVLPGHGRRDARHEVQAVGADRGRRGGAQRRLGRRAEGAGHGAGLPDVASEAPGVDPGQGGHAVAHEERLESLGGPPIGGLVGEVAHHDPAAVRPQRLVVGRVGAVVADVRAREGDDLPRVRGVGDDLLVAAHGRVEDELPGGDRHGGAGRLPREHRAVRGDQQRRRAVLAGAHRCAAPSTTTASPRSTVWRTAPSNVRPA